jgi:hypothetical protein
MSDLDDFCEMEKSDWPLEVRLKAIEDRLMFLEVAASLTDFPSGEYLKAGRGVPVTEKITITDGSTLRDFHHPSSVTLV